ncbi:MAG TPA: bifunctional diaminohydroxyphosphoribosylaminopyrimidine deaminase/5-amino-6-(5-phosphoribosylamino)uracil reductase RibD [Blastocatellia bacterium]|nr:bifunctional diaminohydroxyphosphoribosylaminopyrimidine deaminase/5-amino-6-(5-phosphoribosylamino)uracil reductase RibD [Blastocatellia bacterium]
MNGSDEKRLKYTRTGMPFVTVKFAQSLDGRIATATGDSQWISGSSSLKLAHKLRREHHAILVGIGTVLRDDPRLTVRLVNGRDPLRVILDSNLRLPAGARVLAGGAALNTLIITTAAADLDRAAEIESLGAEILKLESTAGRTGVDVRKALENLGGRGIPSVLVEGGAATVTSLLAARLVDRLVVAIAPKIIGRGTDAIGELGIENLNDALTFSSFKTRRLGPDIIVDARLAWERPGTE